VVVREQEARSQGDDLRAFMQALAEGEHAVREDPQAAAALIDSANPTLEPKLQLESIKQTLPAATPAKSGVPYGWQEPSDWSAFASWMYSHGLLTHAPGVGLPPFTNEYLPGQGI
jgi:ABC-type nitrate/sulfonate/bicarbonate transport system substrate-binding protein